MKYILLFLLTISYSYALTEDEIVALSKKPHDGMELRDELKIFPTSRKTSSTITVKIPNIPDQKDVIQTTSKNINGKYIVHETNIIKENVVMKYIYVVTFSEESKMYKMWTRSHFKFRENEPVVILIESDGMHIKGSQFITWSQVPQKNRETHSVVISELRPEGEKWVSYDYRDGEIVTIIKGVDTIIEK